MQPSAHGWSARARCWFAVRASGSRGTGGIRDQLRAVEKLAASDPATARLILSTKVVQLTELYFDLRQRWTPPPKQRLEVLMRNDRAVYDLVVAYYEEASLPGQIMIARALFDAVFDH